MSEQYSFNTIDSLLIQLAFDNRELSRKKNELIQQIKVCRADIAEKKLYIETSRDNIKKLEEEICARENTVKHNKANVKSMRMTNCLILQHERILKGDLENKKASYSHDVEMFDDRIATCTKKFESYNERYLQNPLAQKLVVLQAEIEEIECRLKACDDQITMKQKEFDRLTAVKQHLLSPGNSSQTSFVKQPEKQLVCQQEEHRDASIDLSSLLLEPTQDDGKTSEGTNAEMHKQNEQESILSCITPQNASKKVWSCQQFDEQLVEKPQHEPVEDISSVDGNVEQQSSVPAVQDIMEEVEETEAADEISSAQGQEISDRAAVMTRDSSQEKEPQSFTAEITPAPSASSFSFNFSPTSSPRRSETKSPSFLFSMNSNPSTPGFTGFEVETCSSQDEGSLFAFNGSLFNDKKTNDPKSSGSPEFLFGQTEPNDDFQFAFSAESPQSADKGQHRQDFPFSFNF
ncbi:protein SIX6OS1 [Gouania willdenowi]|uniref:protein SIX6OS1 n=1 Tax=Gouania willdenowi TaxID=441366 RepID=UPI001054B01D|nr:protein SIX6OS1-like [Gouania willdenowi]